MLVQLSTVGLIIIKNRKLLLAYSKNKQCFYLPGGKIDTDESPEEALCREIAEELNVHLENDYLEYYTHISAPAFGELEGTMMEQECFMVKKEVSPNASAEIGEIRYFSLHEYEKELNQAPGAVMILRRLKDDGHVY